MSEGLPVTVMIALFVLFLFVIGLFMPMNAITGSVILEDTETCGSLGCLQLCDTDDECTEAGETCCATEWASNVCDLQQNCEVIAEYSTHQSLEEYQDTVREQPEPVQPDLFRFFLPIVLVVGILAYFVFMRKDKRHR